MFALSHISPEGLKPTQVALAGPCPHRPWEMGRQSNPRTLAEPRVR
jgi:hypothetical protein